MKTLKHKLISIYYILRGWSVVYRVKATSIEVRGANYLLIESETVSKVPFSE